MKIGDRARSIIRVVIYLTLAVLWWKEILVYWKIVVSFICLALLLWTLNIQGNNARIAVFSAILAAVLALMFSGILR